MKLLLAEDEVDMSEALVDILTYHKYTVDAVFDGEEALDYATIGEYDGIILDIMMPKMSGLEVLQKLRSRGDRTPVLLLTAKAEVEDRIAGLDMGGRLSSEAICDGRAACAHPGNAPAQGRVHSGYCEMRRSVAHIFR